MQINLHKIPYLDKRAIPWIIWSIAGLFYFFEIILRMLPGTMTGEIMRIFHINATELGVFTAFYYWSYTIMQIPAGLIVDRFSVRKTLLAATGLCLAGFILIHSSNQLGYAEIGRFIVGLGSAFAYVSALKVASVWLPKNHFGLASTIVDSLGMIGALFAEIVLVRISINSGYESAISIMILTGIIVGLLILFVLRDAPDKVRKDGKIIHNIGQDKSSITGKLLKISKSPQIWLIGLVGMLFYLPSSVLGDVFGIPYLKNVYHLTRSDASMLMASFFAGWTILGPFLGAISDKIQLRCLPIKLTILVNAILFSIVIFTPPLTHHLISYPLMLVIFFVIGVATGTHPLTFALAKENFSIKMAGTVVAVTNTIIMLGGLIFQPVVGLLLDMNHHTVGKGGFQQYTASNYTFALSIIPISLIIALVVMHFVKETGFHLSEDETQDDAGGELIDAPPNPSLGNRL